LDKFEEMMQMMSKMTEEEKKKNTEANKALCICPDCPSYNDCAKKNDEIYYCGFGRSPSCITKEVGCICPACPITEKLGLTKQFFCTRGTEREQRGMK
jgi:hypothetical protein